MHVLFSWRAVKIQNTLSMMSWFLIMAFPEYHTYPWNGLRTCEPLDSQTTPSLLLEFKPGESKQGSPLTARSKSGGAQGNQLALLTRMPNTLIPRGPEILSSTPLQDQKGFLPP